MTGSSPQDFRPLSNAKCKSVAIEKKKKSGNQLPFSGHGDVWASEFVAIFAAAA